MSIFDLARPDEWEILADTIVTAVFMGLVGERLTRRRPVFIGYGGGYDGYVGAPDRQDAKAVSNADAIWHVALRDALVHRFPAADPLLVIGPADKWVDASKQGRAATPTSAYVITGARSVDQVHVPMSMQARQLALDMLNSNHDQYGENQERGAYYGVADLTHIGEVFGPIASTRQVFRPASGRWMKPSALDAEGSLVAGSHGMIYTKREYDRGPGLRPKVAMDVVQGSFARMHDTASERALETLTPGDDFVVGYCHGMIFAEHICHVEGGGTAYEVSMNRMTCKNASCFGCSTFMFANEMPPSWMHIGSAESWVPLPEAANEFSYTVHFGAARVVNAAREMNDKWRKAVACWMRAGVAHTARSPQHGRLHQQVDMHDDRTLANWFLDALTMHGRDDVLRIVTVLNPAAATWAV
jgi:hypothetical protein